MDSWVNRVTAPFERLIGFTLLGSQTIQTMNRFPLGLTTGAGGSNGECRPSGPNPVNARRENNPSTAVPSGRQQVQEISLRPVAAGNAND